jgi:hypothetical protein
LARSLPEPEPELESELEPQPELELEMAPDFELERKPVRVPPAPERARMESPQVWPLPLQKEHRP